MVDTLEHELRQTAADEHTKQNKQDGGQGESYANKGKGTEKGKHKGTGKGKDTKGKQGEDNVPSGSNSNAQDRQPGIRILPMPIRPRKGLTSPADSSLVRMLQEAVQPQS